MFYLFPFIERVELPTYPHLLVFLIEASIIAIPPAPLIPRLIHISCTLLLLLVASLVTPSIFFFTPPSCYNRFYSLYLLYYPTPIISFMPPLLSPTAAVSSSTTLYLYSLFYSYSYSTSYFKCYRHTPISVIYKSTNHTLPFHIPFSIYPSLLQLACIFFSISLFLLVL